MKMTGRDIKIFAVALILAVLWSASSFFTNVKSGSDFGFWLFALLVLTLILMFVIRLALWVINKVR